MNDIRLITDLIIAAELLQGTECPWVDIIVGSAQ